MKKINKKIFSLLFALVCFVSVGSVKALSVGDRMAFNWNGSVTSSKVRYGNHNYYSWNYYVNYNGNQYKAYCIDGTRPNDGHGDSIEVKKVFDFSTGNTSLIPYYGMYYILTNGARSTSSSAEEIVATDIAIRAYSNVILSLAKGSDDKNSSVLNFGINTALEVPLETAFVMDLSNSCKKSASAASDCIKDRFENITVGGTTLNGDYSRAKELFKGAIKATYDLKMNKNKLAEYKISKNETLGKKDDETGQYLTKIIELTFKINNLPSDGYVNVKRSDITCDKCGTNPEKDIVISNVEYLDTDGNWKTLENSNINLAAKKNSSNEAKLRITWHQPPKENNAICDQTNIKVNYHTYDPRYKFYLSELQDDDTTYTQRYYSIQAVNSENPNVSTRTYSFPITPTCQAETACNTELESPICSDENDGIASVKGPSDIKTCVIDKADDAGNTYQLTTANGGVDNRYCSTYCKEDYATIKLNRGVKDPMPKCGGYFKLNASIAGSQSCYHASKNSADKSIDKTLFVEDIVDAQVNLAEARNLYIKATEAGKQAIQTYSGNSTIYFIQSNYTATVLASSDANGKVTWKTESRPYEYRGNTKADVENAIKADLEKAEKDLSQDSKVYNDGTAYGQFVKIINNYNACTSSWNHTFNFDPKVYWGYSEEYDKLLDEDARDMAVVDGSKKSETNISVCTGTVDNEFNTCNGSTTNWKNTDDASIYSQYTFSVCDKNGCHDVSQSISNATFVKQETNASADYTTPEVFYQVASSGPASGAITTNKDFKEPNIQLTPVGGLPIALDSTGGGSFRLRVDGLGEFHDTGDAGRIIGYVAENNKLDRKLNEHSVAYKLLQNLTLNIDEDGDGQCDKNCDTNNDGVADSNLEFVWGGDYQCHFYNECRPKDCPNCDFECEGPLCHWKECPTCSIECVNCIYNLGKLQLNNKQISTTNIGSAGREYGYNWNINTLSGDLAKQLKLIQDKAKETREEIEAANDKIYDDSNPTDENSELDFSITLKSSDITWIRNYNKEAEKNGGYGNQSLECYDYEGTDKKVYPNQFCYSTFIDELKSKGTEIVAKGRDAKGERTESDNSRILKSTSTYWEPWDKTHESLTEYRNKFGEDVIGGIASK